MVVAFLSLGFAFLLTDLFIETVPAPNRYYVGSVLILWSVLRAWLAWQKEKRLRQEEDNEENHPHNRRRHR
jgi:uncharacterized membrane protein YidH (DUF202 family)